MPASSAVGWFVNVAATTNRHADHRQPRHDVKIIAAADFAATACKSPIVGVVINVSNVPVDFSSANSRIVMIGAASSTTNQKK